jgi:hypothetical protein
MLCFFFTIWAPVQQDSEFLLTFVGSFLCVYPFVLGYMRGQNIQNSLHVYLTLLVDFELIFQP